MTTPARSQIPIAVLGAGLTGMSAALEFESSRTAYRIFEKLSHPGGHAITLEEGGFRFDRTGHLLHLRDPAMRKRVLDWIGEDHVQIQRQSKIWSHGGYTRYPFQANTHGLPPEVAYECLLGFLEAREKKNEKPPENFLEFCQQSFGEGISKHFMVPYNARLWGVHPTEITSEWCQRFVPQPKLEDVVAGAVGLNDRELGYNANFVYPRKGIGVLPEAMSQDLPGIELNRAPTRIDLTRRELVFDDEIVGFDVLVSSAPLDRLLGLLEPLPEIVRDAASKLRKNHLYYLDVASNHRSGEPLHWVYVPEEKYPCYRIGCYSNFSEQMAPPGKSCFYVELADRREPDLGSLLPRVTDAMTEMNLIRSADDIAFARLRRLDHAYVIFDHAYYDALRVIKPFLEEQRIISAGRYGDWNYSSMEDALCFGQDAAKEATKLCTG